MAEQKGDNQFPDQRKIYAELARVEADARKDRDEIKGKVGRLEQSLVEHVYAIEGKIDKFLAGVQELVDQVKLMNRDQTRNWVWNTVLVASLFLSGYALLSGWQHQSLPWHPSAGEKHQATENYLGEMRARLSRLENAE